jgi:hypothetical protein
MHKCHIFFIILKKNNLFPYVNSYSLHKQTFPSVTNDLSYSVHISIHAIYSLDWTAFVLKGSDSGVLHLVSLAF